MYTENHIEFDDELINRTGYYLWMHSIKCRHIRIGFYIALLISTILTVIGFLRHLVLHTDWTMTIIFLILDLLLFGAVTLIWPLVFRTKVIQSIHPEVPQIVTMDENFINLHTSMSHQQYKWYNFIDMEEDEKYYFLFSPDVYIILSKAAFPKGGEEIFRSFRIPARLIKEAARGSKKEKYLILFTHDYLTPLVSFSHSLFKFKNNEQ
ncbi:MAG: YcxB family protein [Lachnospiraceae bacterium]